MLLVFVSIHVSISLAAIARQSDALALVQDPNQAGSGMARQIAFSLSAYNSLFLVSLIFSGLWIIPLGRLVYQCGFIPRVIGVFLMLGSAYYLMSFAGWVIDPTYADSLIGRIRWCSQRCPQPDW